MAFRAGSQNDSLLERLKEGPVTNSFMIRSMCIFKYTSRISDIRKYGKRLRVEGKKGFDIICYDLGDGLSQYVLVWDK